MRAKYEVFISYGSEVIAKVKVDNRQDKNNMPPIIRFRGIKKQIVFPLTCPLNDRVGRWVIFFLVNLFSYKVLRKTAFNLFIWSISLFSVWFITF